MHCLRHNLRFSLRMGLPKLKPSGCWHPAKEVLAHATQNQGRMKRNLTITTNPSHAHCNHDFKHDLVGTS